MGTFDACTDGTTVLYMSAWASPPVACAGRELMSRPAYAYSEFIRLNTNFIILNTELI